MSKPMDSAEPSLAALTACTPLPQAKSTNLAGNVARQPGIGVACGRAHRAVVFFVGVIFPKSSCDSEFSALRSRSRSWNSSSRFLRSLRPDSHCSLVIRASKLIYAQSSVTLDFRRCVDMVSTVELDPGSAARQARVVFRIFNS